MTDDQSPPGDAGGAERRDPDAGPRAPDPPAPGAPVAPEPRASFVFLLVVAALALAADLGSKAWAKSTLEEPKTYSGRKISVIGDHVSFIFAKNPGGAWGLLSGESEALRRTFFLAISAAAIIFIVTLYRRVTPQQVALKWGLPLVLGGALGNLVDRIRYGYVIDFIDVHVTRTFRWPTFNIADIAIVVGVGLMAIDMFTARKPAPAAPASRAASPAETAPTAESKGEP